MDLLSRGAVFAFALSAVAAPVWATGAGEASSGGTMMSAADTADVSFQEADQDGSGFVDAPEAKELGLDVVQYDTNFDGVISRTEWERAPEQATEPSDQQSEKQ